MNTFTTSGYAMPSSPTWWNLSAQSNGEGNQQNPRFIQIESGASNVTLYKITVMNSPLFHISTTGAVSGLTAWDVKIVTPTYARNTDGIDPGSVTNGTIVSSWVSDGDDNVAIGASSTMSANISVINNHFFAGHGESIGSYTEGTVSNILFDGNMLAGNDISGAGSAINTSSATIDGTTYAADYADGNSTAIRIKTSSDRGGTVSNIQYSNSCILDHKTDVQFTPYYNSTDGTDYPNYTNILMQNLVFLNDAGSAGSVELDGYYNSNGDISGGSAVTYPLNITMDNVTFPSALSSLVSSIAPSESTSVWNYGGFSGGQGQYVNFTAGPGQVSTNLLTAYNSLSSAAGNFDTLTNDISQTALDPPACVFTYIAPELTGINGLPQSIYYGNTATLYAILTPAVGGAAYPTGTVTVNDTTTGNSFTGTLSGIGDTLAVTVPASDLTVGVHTFTATYLGDSNYTIPSSYQTFGSYNLTVVKSTPAISAWPTASGIVAGQTLASSALTGGTASVAGTFAWTNTSLAPPVGTAAYSVTFTPTDAIDYSSVTGSVSVTVIALDFTIASSGPTTQTVVAGGTASYQFSIAPVSGSYPGAVTFTANGLPSGSSATFSPSSIAVNGGAQTVTMAIQTTAMAAGALDRNIGRVAIPATLVLVLLPLLGAKKIRRQASKLRRLSFLVLLLGGAVLASLVSGCGGTHSPQPPQNYTITVNATGGGLQHSVSVTLIVQ
jgi:hypothetical protein